VLLPEAAVNALIDQNCVCPSFRAISQAVWVYILAVGDPADLVVLAGDTVTSAVMDVLPDRTVLRAGRVVADGLALV